MFDSEFTNAHQLHMRGAIAEALAGYQRVLASEPAHRLALIFSGIALGQCGELEPSLACFDQACLLDPNDAQAQYNRACSLQRLERFEQARLAIESACELSPTAIEHHQTHALILLQCDAIEEAIAALHRALALDNGHDACTQKLIALLLHRQRPAEALAVIEQYENALEQKSAKTANISLSPDVLFLKARTLWLLDRYQEAIDTAQLLSQHESHRIDALCWIAAGMLELGHSAQAITQCDAVLQILPKHPAAINSRIVALNQQRLWACVLKERDALMLDHAQEPEILLNLANAMMYEGQSDEALALLDALMLNHPDFRLAWSNKAACLLQLGRFKEAGEQIANAKAAFPQDPDIDYLAATEQLTLRQDAAVWALAETRFTSKQSKVMLSAQVSALKVPRWNGYDSLLGKRLLIAHEQGLGDAIQFVRFCEPLAHQGAQIIFETPKSLAPFFSQCQSITQIVSDGDPLPACDYWLPMMSIPAALNIDVNQWAGQGAYLQADPDKSCRWQQRLSQHARPRIGLAWRGNIEHPNDYWRSIKLERLLSYLSPDFAWISLHVAYRSEDQALFSQSMIEDYSNQLKDFSDTAGLINQLDLVISVDTSVAHLSAAMGKPTWLLVALAADWRWGRFGESSLWYQSLRLFRQEQFMDWRSCLGKLSAALERQFPKNSISIEERSRIRASGSCAT